jgi:hypothetical protein
MSSRRRARGEAGAGEPEPFADAHDQTGLARPGPVGEHRGDPRVAWPVAVPEPGRDQPVTAARTAATPMIQKR